MRWTPSSRDRDDQPVTSSTGLRARSHSEMLVPTRPPRRPKSRVKIAEEPRRVSGFLRFFNGLFSFAFVLLVFLGAVALLLKSKFDEPGPLAHATVAVIPKGEGVYEIASRLERDGIVGDRRLFMAQYLASRVYGGLAGDKASIKAGEYEVRKNASLKQVLDTLVEGRSILMKISVPEGLTSQQIVERLRAEPNLNGEIAEIPPEGTLLPDTYKFSRGMSRQEILDRMRTEHQKFVAQVWEKRQKDVPLDTVEKMIVMASIIEKETGRADERERVAAVFVNRLRKNMRLQSDPTIIYGLVGGQGSLGRSITRADIDSKTAYNTYQISGLPPGPICNPGRSAIEATLNPAETQDLYFVADGTGGHTFSPTLKDHNEAVQNWRRIEREQKDKEKARANPEPAAPAAAAAPTAPQRLQIKNANDPARKAAGGGQGNGAQGATKSAGDAKSPATPKSGLGAAPKTPAATTKAGGASTKAPGDKTSADPSGGSADATVTKKAARPVPPPQ